MINTKLLNRIFPVAIVISFGMTVSAQHRMHDISGMNTRIEQSFRERFTTKNGQLAPIPISRSAAQKPTVMNSRIVAMYQTEFDGTQYKGVSDSSRFYWSGTRGGDFDYAKFMIYNYLPVTTPLKDELEFVLPLYRGMTFDSLNTYRWDAGTMSFSEPRGRSSTTLTSSGLLNTLTQVTLSGGVWENDGRNVLTWNSDNNLTQLHTDDWDGTVWEPDYRSVLNYNAAKQITDLTAEEWDLGGSVWEGDTRTTYEYTGSDLTRTTSLDWETIGSAWKNRTRHNLGYDNGQWVSSTFQDWNTLTTVWDATDKNTYTYDQDGNLTQQLIQVWNTLTTAWGNDERLTYAYDANGDLSTITIHLWNGTTWEPDERYAYNYTTSGGGSVTSVSRQEWDGGSNSWENKNRVNLNYNQHNRITEVEFQTWDIAGFWDVVANDEKYHFIYETFDDGTSNRVNEIVSTAGFRYYPNPSSAYITIETDNSAIAQVRLMDVTGRMVEQLTPANNTQRIHLPTTQLAPGMYYLQVMHDGKIEAASVQIQR